MSIQEPGGTIRQELQKTVRDIQAEVQRDIRREARDRAEAARERAEAAREQAEAAATAQTTPAPPIPPGVIVTPGTEGRHVFVEGSEFPFRGRGEDIPPEAVEMALGFFFTCVVIIIGLPIARAFARRMDRKAVPAQIPPEITAQLGQLTQAVDAIALEVERISEGQRFATRLLSEQRDAAQQALPAGSDR